MTDDVQSPVETELGAQFWTQPAESLTDTFSFIYAQALAPLREMVRERQGNVLDYMLVERLAFSYAILRQRESGVAIAGEGESEPLTDRTRREMNKDWLDFTLTLKKLWFTEDKNNQVEQLTKKMDKAVFTAIQGLPAEKQREMQHVMADIFESVGI